MPAFRSTLFVLAAAASLTFAMFATSHETAAQSAGPRVTIEGPLPVPVDDSSETVLAFDETLEVSPGPPQGLRLGPIDVSRFRQVRIATRLVEGGAANVTVTALVLMADFPFDVSLLAPGVTLNHSILVDLPGRNLLIALNAASTTTAQISVYGRK